MDFWLTGAGLDNEPADLQLPRALAILALMPSGIRLHSSKVRVWGFGCGSLEVKLWVEGFKALKWLWMLYDSTVGACDGKALRGLQRCRCLLFCGLSLGPFLVTDPSCFKGVESCALIGSYMK